MQPGPENPSDKDEQYERSGEQGSAFETNGKQIFGRRANPGKINPPAQPAMKPFGKQDICAGIRAIR